MKKLEFRKLTAEDVEVRPTDTKRKGSCELLLYIDSRAATNILNEAVGQFGWNMEYKEVGGKTFGRLSIWDEDNQRYAYKEDTGSESNIEADKGLASDILKRCLARWGCDALYSSPKIRIECPDKYYFNDKMTMKFSVSRIKIDDSNKIADLEIVDRFGKVVYSLNKSEVRYTETKSEDRKIKAGGSPEEYREPEEEKDEWLDKLADFYREKKEEDFYAAWSFYRYWKGLIEDGRFPKSLKALWNKWIDSPNRDKDAEEYKKWKKAKDEAKALSDND